MGCRCRISAGKVKPPEVLHLLAGTRVDEVPTYLDNLGSCPVKSSQAWVEIAPVHAVTPDELSAETFSSSNPLDRSLCIFPINRPYSSSFYNTTSILCD